MAYSTEYFWSVIPSNAAGAPSDCPVFSFTTEDEPVSDIILMQEGAVSACAGTFTDEGGLDNNYGNDLNQTLVITPDQPGNVLQVTFTSFNTEEDFDFLTIYDGNSTAAPLIGEFSGVDIVPGVVTSTAVDGSLTFVFTSDASVNRAGWEATVACIDPNAAPECATAYSPADASVEVSNNPELSWQNGGGVVSGYDVYFGTDPDNLVLVSEGQSETTFATGQLDLASTYYWQIVPAGAGGSAEGCPVNSFTTVETLPILMQNGEVTTCSANFYDSGGPDANYSVDESSVLTIFPEISGNLIQVNFTSFDIEEDWEFLTVYDGPDVNSPVIGVFSGNVDGGVIPTTPITSSSTDGSLTFEFTSDASFTFAGWEATVTCIDPNEAPGCAQNYSPADGSTDVSVAALLLSWEQGTGLATGYDVYFGTDPDNLVLVSPNQSETSFNPGQLDLNTTYFWQIIPMNENASAENCVVNSFTTSSVTDINMTDGSVTTCDANFYDSGNIDGNYSTDENYTLTIFPAITGNLVQVDFTFFDIEEDWEFLTIYDGPDANSPQIGIFSGNANGGFIPTQPITSTASDGSLTFVFTSDALFTFAGWEATVTCVDAAALPECAVNYSPADGSTEVSASNASLSWSSGASVVTNYDVYFGTDPDNLVLVSPGQLEANFNPGQLELNTTYYWQIISNNDNGSSSDCPVLSFTTSSATDILQQDGTQTTCNANYYDSGGVDGNYNLLEGSVLTIFPDAPGNSVQVNFSEFDVENGWDFLNIYDGPDNTAPLIGAFTGNMGLGTGTTPSGPITSTSPDGSLTFEFTSDVSVTTAGWVANIVVLAQKELPGCAVNLSPADASVDQSVVTSLSWGAGSGVTLAYDVYFGTDPDNLVLVSEGQNGTTFNPGALEVATTYYWQIVPQNGAGAAEGCAVNSFTTEDQATLNIFNGEITICDATLFDSGGPDNNYLSNEDYTLTVYPSTPGSFIQIDFVSYDSESGFDFLDIYNGNAATGTPAVTLTGGPQVPAQLISSAADGSLTFNFTSDGSVTRSGFEILISCFVPTEAPSCSDNYFPVDASIDVPLNADLSWTGVGFPTSFNVLFGTDPDNLVEVASGITGSTFDPAPLAANTTYYWQIVPSNDFGSATDCPVLSFTTGGSTEIIMNNGTETTCLANFFDSGGPDASYDVDENFTLTVFPDQVDNVIQVVFNSFNVEATWDALYIFNGPDVNSPLIASPNGPTNGGSPAGGWWGTAVIGPFTSTDPSGALTFQFISDGLVTPAGWDALIQCVSTTEVPGCVTNASPIDASLDVSPSNTVFSWTPGDGLTLTYDVYFGTDPDNLILVSPGQTETT
ncbi:MAG: CUB domain-containing protein, partial [Bacteroidia bacterium]